ncbi:MULTISPECIES: HDOD domain-containing protein [unclassified Pseudomonas]|uniref:HDOD domain-containing protein n=1 Tax=unclassified Pseudomonas TaxID=196821 RepID=UPI002AC964BD|nr:MULTISPECIES: HDOD domain-containing protein [unclassified Pseudomonas]MEB0039672.1 HDOD domain-containing protein [Pseudomonas sp. MH10]MEB0075628.1 HDOD domain-containing protein [Pseudomonas sp. MH10out]MEB0093622.1 HDOD domain-containing protein [Pseudomonas sp. CCI4.2]MEB0099895.1 HDOD domain-containing protein [Pseudomonas sp. CCI3.2]MEB0121714.1 HDOD domain-containing protein [Pseudomonas sp. CCI1.2]
MNTMADTVQRDLIRAINSDALFLPTLPEVALKIRTAAENQDISVSELSKVIAGDTALSARMIKVVNSPLMRGTIEVSDLHTAITRLGINYSCNLAIGLVVEQMFQAKSDVVARKMHDIWVKSLQVAGISYTLCRNHSKLKPDKATLAGMMHLIGVLPILTYAEDHFELLSDAVSLNHVIEQIHPFIGQKLLTAWEFPEMLAKVPGEFLDFERQVDQADYVDLVQVATVHSYHGTHHPFAALELGNLPAFIRLGLDLENGALVAEMNESMNMLV